MQRSDLATSSSSNRKKQQPRRHSDTGSENLEMTAWRSLADTYKTVYSYVNSDLRQYGLTPPQYSVLRTLGKSRMKALPMNEIGKEMIVTFANVTTIVDNLERRNYVRRMRDTKDRRVIKVELTVQGRRLFDRILNSHRKEVAKLMRALNQGELKSLIATTMKIRNKIAPPSVSRKS